MKKINLEVEIIEPADPSLPPKLVAAGKVDLAINYQPQLYQQVSEGLPLVRVGALISSPLNSVMVLKNSNIKTLADLKGKKVGYSVSGFEDVLLDTMLSLYWTQQPRRKISECELVTFPFSFNRTS